MTTGGIDGRVRGGSLADATFDTNLQPENMWRDTIFIPPFGMVVIYQRFGGLSTAWAGKTVFYCHFMDHEDQGMIDAFLIANPEATVSNETDQASI